MFHKNKDLIYINLANLNKIKYGICKSTKFKQIKLKKCENKCFFKNLKIVLSWFICNYTTL